MKKKIVILFIASIISVIAVGCSTENVEVKDSAQELADTFSGGDIKEINSLMFGNDDLNIEDSVMDIWGDTSDGSQSGLLSSIFSRESVTVKKVLEDSVEFEIKAPNMENVFNEISNNFHENYTEDELMEFLQNYVNSAEHKTFIVSVPYVLEDGKAIIDYRDEKFVNAVTGGLLDAYKQLYISAIEKFKEGLE